MRMKTVILLAVIGLSLGAAAEFDFGAPGVQPNPVKLETSRTEVVALDARTRVEVNGFDEAIRAEFALWFGVTPEVGLRTAPARRDASGTILRVAVNTRSDV